MGFSANFRVNLACVCLLKSQGFSGGDLYTCRGRKFAGTPLCFWRTCHDRGTVPFFGQPQYFCLKRQAPKPRNLPNVNPLCRLRTIHSWFAVRGLQYYFRRTHSLAMGIARRPLRFHFSWTFSAFGRRGIQPLKKNASETIRYAPYRSMSA